MKKLVYILLLLPSLVIAQSTTENFVVKKNFKTKRTTVSGLSTIPSDSISKVISYFDGLGRAKQSVAVKTGGNKEDIITHFEYDALGRQTKNFLPFTAESNDGAFRIIDQVVDINQYYLDNYATDFANVALPDVNAYSEKSFENSPLNRVLEQAAPGKDWKLTNGHTIKFEYDTNTTTDAVKYHKVTTVSVDNTYTPTLTEGTIYGVGQLSKTSTKDENWTSTQTHLKDHTTEEFKNKSGQVILKRTYNDNAAHDTYYVYDNYGNLTYVLPPLMNASTTALDTVISKLNDLGYQYKYDHRNRLVEKKIPGKGREYIVYDKLDRPVLTQDAIQFNKSAKEWLFTKYDELGRVVYTGIYVDTSNRTRELMQSYFNSQNNSETTYFENKTVSGTGYDNTYYTNANFPNASIEVLTVNYYDNYTFNLVGSGTPAAIGSIYGELLTSNTKSLSTGSKVKVLDTSHWITTISYYDEKARPVYVYSQNDFLGTTDIIESKLDFVGKVLQTRSTHKRTGKTDIVTIDTFTYDHADRLLSQSQCIGDNTLVNCNTTSNSSNITFAGILDLQTPQTIVDNNSITLLPGFHAVAASGQSATFSIAEGNAEQLVSNTYDALGQLKTKKAGNSEAAPLQTVDYAYNVRGWLKNINQDAIADNDLFNFSLKYNDIADVTKKLYNGNISQTSWNTLSSDDSSTKTYTYSYDALNRIKGATGTSTSDYNLSGINYDKNGNILNLQRQGHIVENPVSGTSEHFGMMDNLDYSYNGNQLHSVTDTGDATYGFKDGNASDTTYSNGDGNDDFKYDINGNMTKDANKGITAITYNHLNLPTTVTINGQNIIYTYDATGTKLRKEVSGVATEYAGNYMYKKIGSATEILQFFNHAEGYFNVTSSSGAITGNYVYQYKDHLGNVRLSYADADKNGVINAATEIVEESNYYPFGGSHMGYNNVTNGGNAVAQKFKFSGKELSEDLGLNTYDFGARNYDPYLGRWMNIDPLAERYSNYTPYNYVANTPLQAVDPDGRAIIFIGGLRFSQSDADQQQGLGSPDGFMGRRSGIYHKNDVTKYWSNFDGKKNYHGRSASIDGIFKRAFKDNNAFYLSGSSTHTSSALKRQGEGAKKAELFHKTYGYGGGKNRKIKTGEAIRVVGHSQGGAHAAGFVSQLLTYKNEIGGNLYNVEVIFYLNPHQPGDIYNPIGPKSVQYSVHTDQISGKGLMTFLGFNGGSEYSPISGAETNYMTVFPEGEEGYWWSKRGGHNVTDGDRNIAAVVAEFCRKNPTKCTKMVLKEKG